MPLTDSDARRLQELEELLVRIDERAHAICRRIDRAIRESDRRMEPYQPIIRRTRERLLRAGYRI